MFAAFLLPTILARRHVSALAKPAQERLVRKKPEPLGNRTDRVVAVMQTLAGHRQPHPVENFAITSAEFLQIAMQAARAGAELHRDRFLGRSEEHTSELQSLMRLSYAVFCLKKKNITQSPTT